MRFESFFRHSLPERILQFNDPYPQELRETCERVAPLVGLVQWSFAYQSAGRTGERWLGPDIFAMLDGVAKKGARRVLIAPIGFVADHLEILYDICGNNFRMVARECDIIISSHEKNSDTEKRTVSRFH